MALDRLREALGEALFGQEEVIEALLAVLLARGHALLEGMPGLGKTLLAESLARASGLAYKRIQFTPDLLPQDLTGSEVYREGRFVFVPGPIFAQVVLADEINRAPPKVQSALLEAMQERAVTAGGVRHPLPEPFFVIATQNPLELEGTYPLPEAQLDRFTAKIPFRPPRREVWLRILTEEPKAPEPVEVDLLKAQEEAKEVRVAKEALEASASAWGFPPAGPKRGFPSPGPSPTCGGSPSWTGRSLRTPPSSPSPTASSSRRRPFTRGKAPRAC